MSLQALANVVGATKSQIQRLETGATVMDINWMRRLGAALDVKPTELLNDDDVEFRGGEAERAIVSALSAIAPEDRVLFLRICDDLSRMTRRLSGEHHSVTLSGDEKQTKMLAELWNELDRETRERALTFLEGAAALNMPRAQAA